MSLNIDPCFLDIERSKFLGTNELFAWKWFMLVTQSQMTRKILAGRGLIVPIVIARSGQSLESASLQPSLANRILTFVFDEFGGEIYFNPILQEATLRSARW
jgi:hypothetical protein